MVFTAETRRARRKRGERIITGSGTNHGHRGLWDRGGENAEEHGSVRSALQGIGTSVDMRGDAVGLIFGRGGGFGTE
jgi:hypothetical protein